MQDLLTGMLRAGQERGKLTGSVPPEVMTEKLLVVARDVIFDWCLHNSEGDLIAEMRGVIGRQAASYLA